MRRESNAPTPASSSRNPSAEPSRLARAPRAAPARASLSQPCERRAHALLVADAGLPAEPGARPRRAEALVPAEHLGPPDGRGGEGRVRPVDARASR